MKRCQNAEPGTYGHECGQPAQWTATNRHGQFIAATKTGKAS